MSRDDPIREDADHEQLVELHQRWKLIEDAGILCTPSHGFHSRIKEHSAEKLMPRGVGELTEAAVASVTSSSQSRGLAACLTSSRLSWMVAFALALFIVIDKMYISSPVEASVDMTIDVAPSLLEKTRLLGQSNASSMASSASAFSHAEHEGHQHDAMLFLFNVLIFGTLVSHLLTFDIFQGIHPAVALYILGLALSLILEHTYEHLGLFGRSYNMWRHIDPQILLFTMLPALIAGETLSIDADVLMRVVSQIFYLAGPGVVIGGFLTSLFFYFYLPYGWSYELSLTTGFILCATYPLPVVSMLKELNAAPTLIVLMQGESLLNDGTAIAFYTMTYNLLNGEEELTISYVATSVVWTVLCAWGVGLLLGWIFQNWIAAAHNKLEHHSSIVQISLTICAAYGSYFFAQAALSMSGPLASVAACCVLAKNMWPYVVSRESLSTVWQMLEYFGNTLVFFLAGALTGQSLLDIPAGDYLHLVVLFIFLNITRMATLFLSRPILKFLSKENAAFPIEDALVMGWCGVRGAVSLTLGMQVVIDRAGGKLDELEANRVMFYVGGIAAMTIMVNAQSATSLVRLLGMAQVPETKRRVMVLIHRQLMEILKKSEKAPRTRKSLISLFEERGSVITEAEAGRPSLHRFQSFMPEEKKKASLPFSPANSSGEQPSGKQRQTRMMKLRQYLGQAEVIKSNYDIVNHYHEAKERYAQIPPDSLPGSCLSDIPPMSFSEQETEMINMMSNSFPDLPMLRAMNEAFLSILQSRYWVQIEEGDMVPGTNEAEVLVTSTKLALRETHGNLSDFKFVQPYCKRSKLPPALQRISFGLHQRNSTQSIRSSTGSSSARIEVSPTEAQRESSSSDMTDKSKASTGCIGQIVHSTQFHVAMCIVILMNAILVGVEELQDRDDVTLGWLVVDIVFTVVFTIELLMKLCDQGRAYFRRSWNLFDCFLVILGWAGTIFNIVALDTPAGNDGNLSRKGLLFRFARVFRLLRVLRLFRLLVLFQVLRAKLFGRTLSVQIAEHLQKVTILRCFVRAHLFTQVELIRFFGLDGKPDSFELCRILIQSQTSVFQAMCMALEEEQQLGGTIAVTVNNVKNTKAVAERLEHFIEEAYEQGVVNTHEAESILAPVREHMKAWQSRLRNNHFGMMRRLSLGKRDVMDESYCFNVVPSPRAKESGILSQPLALSSPSHSSGSPQSRNSGHLQRSPCQKGTPPHRNISGNLAWGQTTGSQISPQSPASQASPIGSSSLRLGRFDGLVPSPAPIDEMLCNHNIQDVHVMEYDSERER